MKEQLYTIPVNEAFEIDCECPICAMYHKLKEDALDFTLGPSYMEDDIRMVTDKVGFCKEHVQQLYDKQNRLGLALMLKTHADKTIRDTSKLINDYKPEKPSFFKKNKKRQNQIHYSLIWKRYSIVVLSAIKSVPYLSVILLLFFSYTKRKQISEIR